MQNEQGFICSSVFFIIVTLGKTEEEKLYACFCVEKGGFPPCVDQNFMYNK